MTRSLLLLTLFSVGCGATPRQSTVLRPTELPAADDLVALAPPASRGFVFLDLAGIRSTRLYAAMDEDLALFRELSEQAAAELEEASPFAALAALEALEEGQEGEVEPAPPEEPEAEPLDVLTRADWIFVASNPRRNPPTAVSFFGARFTDEEARATVRLAAGGGDLPELPFGMGAPQTEDPLGLGVADEEAARVRVREVRGLRAFVAREYQLVELREGLWVLATEGDVRGVLDRRGGAASDDGTRLHDRIGLFDHHLVMVTEDARTLRELVEEEGEDGETEVPEWVRQLSAGGLRVDVDGGIRADWLLEVAEGADAEAVRAALTEAIEETSQEPFVRLYHLSAPIAAMEPVVRDGRIEMSFALDARESELLWARISGAAAMVIGAIQVMGDFMRGFGGMDDFGLPTPSLDSSMPAAPLEAFPGMSPVTIQDTAGGDVDAESVDPSCVGWIGMVHHPLSVVEPMRLRVLVRGASDSTLAVQLEDGTWVCNDDTEGTDPVVELELPAGQHRIYVGAFDRFDLHPYTLGVTPDLSAMPSGLPEPVGGDGGEPDAIVVRPDGPDPQLLEGIALGEIDISGLAGDCTGFTTDLPTHAFEVHTELPRLRVLARAEGSVGVILRRPDGELVCGVDRDGAFYDGPGLAGPWDVWVTVPTQGAQAPYVLGLSRSERARAADLPAP